MRKQVLTEVQRSVQERARAMAARRVQQADTIARVYSDANMKMLFPGEEVD